LPAGARNKLNLLSFINLTGLKKSFAFQAIERGALRRRQSPAVMKIKPFGLSEKKQSSKIILKIFLILLKSWFKTKKIKKKTTQYLILST
jgi:hypothetical protein